MSYHPTNSSRSLPSGLNDDGPVGSYHVSGESRLEPSSSYSYQHHGLAASSPPGSPTTALRQLQMELDATKRDLESKEDLLAMTKREQERLRSLLSDTREEFRNRVEEIAGEKAGADSRVLEQKIEVEKERSARKEIQRELQDAINDRERQADKVTEVKRQVEGKLTMLMTELHKKEEQLRTLQHQADSRSKEKEKVVMLEKMLASRDQQLSDVTTEYTALQTVHQKLLVTSSTLQQEVDALRLLRENDLQSALASPPRPPPEPSLTGGGGGNSPYGGVVVEPHLLLPSQVSFAKDMMKDHTTLSSQLDSLYDDMTDLHTVLHKGTSHSVDPTDRKRLAALRQLDLSLQEQRRHAEDESTPEQLQSTIRGVREGGLRVKSTMVSLIEFVRDVKTFVEKHCPYGLETSQLPTIQHQQKPAAWPLPGQEPASPGRNTPPSQGPGTPILAAGSSGPSASTTQQSSQQVSGFVPAGTPAHHLLQDMEARLKHSDENVASLRKETLDKDKEISKLRFSNQELHHKLGLTESNLARVESDLKRSMDSLSSIKEREDSQAARIAELQKDLSVANESTRDEREKHLNALAETQREQDQKLQTAQREFDFKIREAEQKHDHEMRSLASKLDKTLRDLNELGEKEHKAVQEAESYVERMKSLKSQRDEARKEGGEMKEMMMKVAQEARHYQQCCQDLEEKNSHLQSVLDFEMNQRPTDNLVNGGLPQTSGLPFNGGGGAQHSQNLSRQNSATVYAGSAANPSAVGMFGDEGGSEWKEWKSSRKQQQQGVEHSAAPSQTRASSSSRRSAPPGVKLVRGPSPSITKGRGGRFH